MSESIVDRELNRAQRHYEFIASPVAKALIKMMVEARNSGQSPRITIKNGKTKIEYVWHIVAWEEIYNEAKSTYEELLEQVISSPASPPSAAPDRRS